MAKPMKTEDGVAFPASDYAYVPDPETPSTWKLRLTKTPGGTPDAGIVGAAAAALGPGYRGQKVEIPEADLAKVKARVRAAWKQANPDKRPTEMPEALRADEPTSSDVHVPAPMGGPSPHFLRRLYRKLREFMRGGKPMGADEWQAMTRDATAHAGGMARAAARSAAEGDAPSGFMVALMLDPQVAKQLALPGGEAPEDLHITVWYGGNAATLGGVGRAQALLAAQQVARESTPLVGRTTGIGRFLASPSSDGKDVIYAVPDLPGLDDLRDDLCDALCACGMEADSDFAYTPHITLAYVEPGAPFPVATLPALPLRFESLCVCDGPVRTDLPLLGWGDDDGDLDGMAMGTGAASGAADAGTYREWFRTPRHFADAPEWIPYLPRPGVYQHPSYGEITITAERNARFVENFNQKVYQDKLPLDAEHQTKLSGATGWIIQLRQNTDKSVDAKVDWTDRGRALIAADRYRYMSPEWYDLWVDPATGQQYQDVAIGGALTTRPFFKSPALRPLVATERGHRQQEDPMPVDEKQFGELQAQLKSATDTIATQATQLKTATETIEAQGAQLKSAGEAIAKMEASARTQRLLTLMRGEEDSPRWFGEAGQHLAMLELLAKTYGEDSAELKAYVTQQRALAEQLHTSALFQEIGGSGDGATGGAWQKVQAEAKKLTERDPKLTQEQAIARVLDEQPQLYAEYRAEERASPRQNGRGRR